MVMTERLPPTVQRTIDSSTKRITSMCVRLDAEQREEGLVENESTSITLPAIRQQTAAARASSSGLLHHAEAADRDQAHQQPRAAEGVRAPRRTRTPAHGLSAWLSARRACEASREDSMQCKEKDDAQTWTRKHPMDMITCSRFMK